MPRPAKGSPEAKARAAKMRAARQTPTQTEVPAQPDPVISQNSDQDYNELKRQLEELKAMIGTGNAPQRQQPQTTQQGMVGTLEKFSVRASDYPNPCDRLAHEARLQRFAFGNNYELKFDVGKSSYTTIDNVRIVEPKFGIELIRIIFDEDTGESTDKRYVLNKLVFHEDPDTAMTLADEMGIDYKTFGEKEFLDEMRYMRMRDWLLECFYPPKPPAATERKSVIIGNRLVEVYTANAEVGEGAPKIPYSDLKSKV